MMNLQDRMESKAHSKIDLNQPSQSAIERRNTNRSIIILFAASLIVFAAVNFVWVFIIR